jgi:hypothetical protein
MKRARRRVQVGVAIGPDAVTLVPRMPSLTRGLRWRMSDSAPEPISIRTDAERSDCEALLEEALARLRRTLPDARLRLHLALLPGVCETRIVPMPPLRDSELAIPIRRDTGRWFPGARQSRVVGAWRIPAIVKPEISLLRGKPRHNGPVIASAVPAGLLDALLDAAAQAGAEVVSALPAVFSWIAFAGEQSRTDAGGSALRVHDPANLIIVDDGHLRHLMAFENGWLSEMRRYRPAAMDRLVADLVTYRERSSDPDTERDMPMRIIVLAPACLANAIATRFDGDFHVISDSRDTGAITATYAHAGPRPGLVPEAIVMAGRRRAAQAAKHLAAAALVMLALAGAAELHGLRRELAAVRSLRLDLAPRVGPAMVARDSLLSVREQLAAIDGVTGRGPSVAETLVEIAMLLPEQAHLTDLALTPDTMRMHGEALRSAEALQALRAAAAFAHLEFEGPIRRELRGDSAAIERFTISGALEAHGVSPADSNTTERR